MPRLNTIPEPPGPMSRTAVRSQRTYAIHHGEKTAEDLLEVSVFDGAGVETEILANDVPYRLEVLLLWHFKSLILYVCLTD
jgi:hypothetical protein